MANIRGKDSMFFKKLKVKQETMHYTCITK